MDDFYDDLKNAAGSAWGWAKNFYTKNKPMIQ